MTTTTNNLNSPQSNNHKDLELQHSEVETQMNVDFVEEQPLVQDDARLGHSLMNLPISMEKQMPDEHWMAAKQLSKPVVIQHFTWTASSGVGTILNAFNFPDVISVIDSIHTETLNMYSFFKFNWNLKFQINGTKFHSGQLMASFDPFYQALDTFTPGNVRTFDAVYATGLPNVKLNASSNQPVEMVIPYVHPRNFMTTNSTSLDNLGRVRISVLNPLRLATGASDTLSVTVYLFATDPSVHVPIYRHIYRGRRAVLAEQSMEYLNMAAGIANQATDIVGNLATGNFGGALKSASPLVGGLASLFGLDYPTRVVHPQSHINSLGVMAHGKGVDQSYRLALDPQSGHVAESEQTGTTVEECSIDYIKKVPMLFRQVIWTDARASGNILTYFPVTCNIAAELESFGRAEQSSNTFLSYLSNMFSFWRGSLDYNFEMISTQFHTGRLLVAFIPNQFSGTPTLAQAYSCPYAVIDLQETSNVQITVPFTSAIIWKSTQLNNLTASDENVVGYVYVYVLNPLVRPSNVADRVEFNIYISAGDDFEFAVPRANLLDPYYFHVEANAEQSMALDRMTTRTSTAKESASISVAFGSPLVPPKNYFGEKFSLIDLSKRYGYLQEGNLVDLVGTNHEYFCQPQLTDLPFEQAYVAGNKAFNTPLSSVQAMFACWSGSMRFKFSTNANRESNLWLLATHIPLGISANGNYTGSGFALQRTNLSQNNALEIEAPCYIPYSFLLNDGSNETGAIAPSNSGAIVLNSNVQAGDTTQLTVYAAAGDDYRPFYLIPPPQDHVTYTPDKANFLHWVADLTIDTT
ncbi:structural polyprotein [Bat badicivirus 1]|uniref:structural polyprotein n=1 Tax=Bat badicivirus 1 TaxID=1958785 RepID=UPI000983A8D2|nr:structural polyprotein [Bat badicivirus 1]AQP31144.1 structural polyprotein [Bat badicivirus 1]